MFEIDMGYYPKGRDGLNQLVVKPSGATTKWHKYLDVDKLPNDPWNRPYVYENPGKHNPDGYDVYSLGPEGKGGTDALGNWTVVEK
jgi:general secretion pathway protein G